MSVMTVPNLLCILRFILIIAFLILSIEERWMAAFVCFSVAGFTDMIDGTIARVFNQQSRLGAILDPAADKFMMLIGMTVLALEGILHWGFFIWFVLRDFYLIGGILYLMRHKIPIQYKPIAIAKLHTFLQIIIVIFGGFILLEKKSFVHWNYFSKSQNQFYLLLGTTLFVSFLSIWRYQTIGFRLLRQCPPKS